MCVCVCLFFYVKMQMTGRLLPSLLPLRVSDEMLWGREPKESKLSRESSLLCPLPPLSW